MVELVEYREALSIKVGKFVLSKGFDLADSMGKADNSLVQSDSLGILYKDPEAKPIKSLFGLIKRERRRMFLGVVWFNNSVRNANKQNWLFQAYGRKYIKLVRQLADEMAFTFNVKITLHLVREQPDIETYLSDYDY